MAGIALAIVRGLSMAKSVRDRAIPLIKLYACKDCSSLAVVRFHTDTNKVTLTKCACSKKGN